MSFLLCLLLDLVHSGLSFFSLYLFYSFLIYVHIGLSGNIASDLNDKSFK